MLLKVALRIINLKWQYTLYNQTNASLLYGLIILILQACTYFSGPSEAAYLKLSPSEAEFGSKSSELSRVEFAFRVGQKLPIKFCQTCAYDIMLICRSIL